MTDSSKIRNVAIIAHVDHGKTTLVDALLRQSGMFSDREVLPERMMDSMDLERERGITIAAKNCTLKWQDLTINIVDTPGHSDFGGEVERILSMVDGALVLVDAAEGPLPQTRFVLKKAIESGLSLVVVINKIDRPDQRTVQVEEEILSLIIDCGGTDTHLDSPVVYAIARDGLATTSLASQPKDISPIFEAIRDSIPPPEIEIGKPLSILVANLDYSDYVGRLAIGRIRSGSVKKGDQILVLGDGKDAKGRVAHIYGYQGLQRAEIENAEAGLIVAIAGLEEVTIGDTLTSIENPVPQPRIKVEEPTVTMIFGANTSPFTGRDGEYVTSRQLKDRLAKESRRNVSLKIEEGETPDKFRVSGRGELQLAVLIEQMRREGFELEVSKPRVIERVVDGERQEPFEILVIDIAEEYLGTLTETLGSRRGIMTEMSGAGSGRVRATFQMPSRGLIGIRSILLTKTRGTAVIHSIFDQYRAHAGKIPERINGSIIADRTCPATSYAIEMMEDRGKLFVSPGDDVYQGMVVGEHAKESDIEVYIGRPKKLTNMRASGSDDAILLTPAIKHTLENAMEWINEDELVEVTPKAIRIRKKFLDPHKRKANERP